MIAVLLPVTAVRLDVGDAQPRARDGRCRRAGRARERPLARTPGSSRCRSSSSHAVYAARLTPAEAIVAATVNAAHAIGAGDRAGAIAVGRPADFATFDLESVERIPYRIGPKPVQVYRQGIAISLS